MNKLKKRWGFIRCAGCYSLARAKYDNCEHCDTKLKSIPKRR